MANNKKHKTQTGGLQEKKVKVELTKEEIKEQQKEIKEKRREKAKANKKERRGLITRLKDMGSELRRVEWPSFGKTMKQTGVVLGVVLVFAVVIFGIDRGLSFLYDLLQRGIEPPQG